MRKFRVLTIVAITGAIAVAACGPRGGTRGDLLSEIKARGYMLISTDPNRAPLSFLNGDGQRPAITKCPPDALTTDQLQGFDVDIAAELSKRLGVEPCFATQISDAITAGRWADKWDISMGSMSVTPERQRVLDFTAAYYFTPAVVAVTNNSGITSFGQLAGKALCVGASTTYEDWLKRRLDLPAENVFTKPPAGVTVVSLDTDEQCAREIQGGRPDFAGYVSSQAVVNAVIAAGLPAKQLGGPVFVQSFAAAFDKASSFNTAGLRAEVDTLLSALHKDGTLTVMSNKWFQTDLSQAPTP